MYALTQIQIVVFFAAVMLFGSFYCASIGTMAVALGTGLVLCLLFFVVQDQSLSVKALTLVGLLMVLLLSGLPVVFCLMSIGLMAMLFWLPPVSLIKAQRLRGETIR